MWEMLSWYSECLVDFIEFVVWLGMVKDEE